MLHYMKGDATDIPAFRKEAGLTDNERVIITHITNDVGAWGAGFTGALDKRFGSWPRQAFLGAKQQLGQVAWADSPLIHPEVTIAHMCAQRGVGTGIDRVQYEHLMLTLDTVFRTAITLRAHVVMPKIGAGLGGGNWEFIQAIIQGTHTMSGMRSTDLDVYVLTL